jgi:DNA primase
MTRIPDEFVEELRKAVDIVDVISDYVPLRRTGRSYVGLCPFHSEKTPSFSVSPDRQLYHCFGCGAGGTVIRFVMEIDGLSFAEAVAKLADRAGLTMPVPVGTQPDNSRPSEGLQQMLEALQLAAKYYNYILMNSAAGVQALTYLENRGISRQTMVDFQLGSAPDAEDALVRFLRKRGFDAKTVVEAGLGIALDGKVVDRFRRRLMVPICNEQGKVVAFGGRTLVEGGKPKYLNSPETALFRKSNVLYNLHLAKQDIRKSRSVVLMEGYMDVLAAWQAGVHNVVGTMGTALTEEHVQRLKRYANRLILAFDGDAAGVNAAKRAMDIAGKYRFQIRVAEFPEGQDPDDFIRSHGASAFVRQVQQQAVTEVEFLLSDLRRHAKLDSLAGQTDFLRSALAILGTRGTPIEQDAEVRRLAQEFHVSVDALKEELRLISKHHPRPGEMERRTDQRAYRPEATLLPKDVAASNKVLQALLTNAEAFGWLIERGVDELALPEQTALLAHLYHFRSEHPDGSAAAFVDSLEDPQLARLASSLLMDDPPEFSADVIDDCLRTIRLDGLQRQLNDALQQLVLAQVDGRDDVDLLRQKVERLKSELAAFQRSP